jgi:hypothetical protein
MKIKHLRKWLDNLPKDYNEAEIVFRTIKEGKNDKDNLYVLDIPIAACGIDESNNEMYFCDTQSSKAIES